MTSLLETYKNKWPFQVNIDFSYNKDEIFVTLKNYFQILLPQSNEFSKITDKNSQARFDRDMKTLHCNGF